MVVREGFYGDVLVTWQIGYPTDSMPQGFTAGQIEPKEGVLTFNGLTRNQTFQVEVRLAIPAVLLCNS